MITIGGSAARKRARSMISHSRSASGTTGTPASVVGCPSSSRNSNGIGASSGGRRDPLRRVVVDAVEVERLADRGQVAVAHLLGHQRLQVDRVAAEQHRLEHHAVPDRVEELGRADVGGVVAARPHRGVVVRAADAGRARRPQRDRAPAVGEQQVVHRRQRVEQQLPARARAPRCRSRRAPRRWARSPAPSASPGRRSARRRSRRSPRTGRRWPGSASRRRPRAAAAGPSGRA